MAFQLSPGVLVSEVDLTTVVPSVSTTAGAFAGEFVWGPVNKRYLVPDEVTLNNKFGSPDSNTYVSFLTAASFLAYGNTLWNVRTANNTSYNADANTSGTNIQIANEDVFQALGYIFGTAGNAYGAFMARYPGAYGNSLTVTIADAGNWSYVNTAFQGLVNGAPGTSVQAAAAGSANDEVHILVTDTGGLFSGTKGTVLEVWPYLSKGSDAIDPNGNSAYWKQSLFNNSQYIYGVDAPQYAITSSTWGKTLASNTSFAVLSTNTTFALSGGTYAAANDADKINGYGLFASADDVDISLVITGGHDATVQQYAIENIAGTRLDCVAFVSPPLSAVLNTPGNEVTNITSWYNSLSIPAQYGSYAVADSGWKYMFDKYNNTYRWVPLNGDIAGLCVYTDTVRDPWWSPAGLNRGGLKNVVRLAWNPNKTYRDALYSISINPVVSLPGNGTVLYGDKTLTSKPSAFDRINVRRLFITLEKAIAKASQYSLFEFNDEFTRAQFVALVTPYLRDVQGRRGITDFRVVCDTTNNTPQVIDSNQFVGDIYIKPARSINFIQLNFVAVRTGVDFTEVVGTF